MSGKLKHKLGHGEDYVSRTPDFPDICSGNFSEPGNG